MTKQKTPSLVTIAVLTVITVVFWIAFGVVKIFTVKKESVLIPTEVLAPVEPVLNKDAVDNLHQRIYFDKDQIFNTILPETPTLSEEEAIQ
jgi:hypothetical protein